jgi:hypothetical protein
VGDLGGPYREADEHDGSESEEESDANLENAVPGKPKHSILR